MQWKLQGDHRNSGVNPELSTLLGGSRDLLITGRRTLLIIGTTPISPPRGIVSGQGSFAQLEVVTKSHELASGVYRA